MQKSESEVFDQVTKSIYDVTTLLFIWKQDIWNSRLMIITSKLINFKQLSANQPLFRYC